MGFGDLGKLFKKEYRIFLVLVIWLLIGFTLFQFDLTLVTLGQLDITVGFIVFLPLIAFSMALVLIALFTKKELMKLEAKQIITYSLISILIMLILSGITLLIFLIAILSWVFITSLFSMWGCYEKGVSYDESVYNWPRPINFFARWIQFFLFNIIAIILVFVAAGAGTLWTLASTDVANIYATVGWLLIVIMIFLTFIGFLFVFIGRLNAWLSVFHTWVALYSFYLMINAFYSLSGGGGGSQYSLYMQIGLYVFDVLLLLYTIGGIVGKKAEGLSKVLPMKPETILVWLIFSKAAFEFADALPTTATSTLKAGLSFLIFAPMVLIIGIYGIIVYGRTKRERKDKKKKKLADEKELKKEGHKKGDTCKECGKLNKKGAKFCKTCGQKL